MPELNMCTAEVVHVLTDGCTVIRQAKQRRKKRTKDKYAIPEDALERALQRAADELEQLYRECLQDDAAFGNFDDVRQADMRRVKDQALEVKSAIKYTIDIDPKKGVRDPLKLQEKVEAIGNAGKKVMEDFRLQLFRQAARSQRQISQPVRVPTADSQNSTDAPPPQYEEFNVDPLDTRVTRENENTVELASQSMPDTLVATSPPRHSSTQPVGRPVERDVFGYERVPEQSERVTGGEGPRLSVASTASSASPSSYSPRGSLQTPRSPNGGRDWPLPLVPHTINIARQLQAQPNLERSGSTRSESTAMSSNSDSSNHQLPSPLSLLSSSPRGDSMFPRPHADSTSSARPRWISMTSIENVPGREIRGAPSKANDWWGFCQGTWDIQAGAPKAIFVGSTPLGVTNFRRYIQCRKCSFQGPQMDSSAKTPSPDTGIYTHPGTGIRFRWAYLAKSHKRCMERDTSKVIHPFKQLYGCVLCVADGNWSPTLGGLDTLLNHILRFHTAPAAPIAQATLRKNNVVCGRLCLPEESFDLNIPRSFAEKEAAEAGAGVDGVGAGMEAVEIGDGTPRVQELEAGTMTRPRAASEVA